MIIGVTLNTAFVLWTLVLALFIFGSYSLRFKVSKWCLHGTGSRHNSGFTSAQRDRVQLLACEDGDQGVDAINDQRLYRRKLQQTTRFAVTIAAIAAASSGSTAARADTAEDVLNSGAVNQEMAAKFAAEVQAARELSTDEFIIDFAGESLGLKLIETMYKGYPVVTVKEIKDAVLKADHPELEIGAIVVAVNGVSTDGLPLNKIVQMVSSAERPVLLKFRDPSRFFKQLDSTLGPPRRVVSTSYLPANTR